MASIENKPMDGQLVESKEFPNIKVDKGMLEEFDQVMKDLKKGAEADEGVKLFVQKLNELKDYKIYDGSKSDYCIGGHSGGSLKEINIPIEFVKEQGGKGQYYGKLDKNNNAVGLIDATLPRAIVHELAHATKLDREGSPLTKGIVDKLDNLEKQIQLDNKMAGAKYGVYNAKVRQEQGLLSKPLDSLARKEAGAVAVENYIINRVAFNGVKDQSLRLNVGDQGESITAQTLNEWHKAKDGVEGYSMPGTCKNGKPLEKEVTRLTPEQIFEVGTRLAALEPEQQQKLDPTHKAILGAYQLAQNARNQEAEV